MQRLILGFLIIIAFIFVGCTNPSSDNSGNSNGNNNTATTTTLPLTNDVNLCAITLSEGALTPAFAAETTVYNVSVANMVNKIKITGVQAQMTSSVSDPVNITLDADIPQTATIFVTSKSGSKKGYTVTVTRAKADSSNANLRGITLSSGTLTPAFSEGVTAYTTKIPFGESNIILTGLKADSDAVVSPSVTLTNFVVGTAQTATIKVTAKETVLFASMATIMSAVIMFII